MKTRSFTFASLIAGSVLFIACAQPAPEPAAEAPAPLDVDAITTEVQGMEDAYARAIVDKNVDGIMPYYAEDAVSYSSNKEPLRGKDALRQRLAEQMSKDTSGVVPTFKVEEVFAGGDHVTEIGSWSEVDGSGTVVDHGTYFSIFKKNGDKWECIRDISVSAKPRENKEVAMQ